MIFETDQEPISKPRRKLNWIDAILPTLLGVGGCVLLTYVLDRFFAEFVFMLMFNPASAEYMALVPLAAFLLLILAIASALSWKARGRETETDELLSPSHRARMWFDIPDCLFVQTRTKSTDSWGNFRTGTAQI